MSLITFCSSEKYVPGNPGANWSYEEMLIVKAKFYSIFSLNGGYKALQQIYGQNMGNWINVPTEPKFVRLAFHDCLKYEDGSGGCDGCINWDAMDFRFDDYLITLKKVSIENYILVMKINQALGVTKMLAKQAIII